jgi:hypothetical protein
MFVLFPFKIGHSMLHCLTVSGGTAVLQLTAFSFPLYTSGSRGSSVSIVTRLQVVRPGFDSQHGQRRNFLSLQHGIQTSSWVLPASSSGYMFKAAGA